MRATQFVRRGLVAFAAVATLTFGLSGVAGAQGPGAFPGTSPIPEAAHGRAVVWVPVPGYWYDVVRGPDGDLTAVLGVGILGGDHPVVVEFLPDVTGAAVITPGPAEDIIVP